MKIISVLIVDDEQFICESVALKIQRLEHKAVYETKSANSGAGALMLLEKNSFDIIITDIRMPFMTGIQLIKKVREKGFLGKIFVLSGYDDYNYVREAFTSGADDYLLKPISVSQLDEKLKKLLLNKEDDIKPQENIHNRNDVIKYAKDYIDSHYMNSTLSMDEVAKHISVSYSHFSTLFRKETGVTFPTYLRNLRIEKAKELLKDPSLKISEICYRIGFKYPQQLSNDFKKVTGVYPSEYTLNQNNE